MRICLLILLELIFWSCSESTNSNNKRNLGEIINTNIKVDSTHNSNNLYGKYYCLKFNLVDELILSRVKPDVETYENVYQFDFKNDGVVEFKNLIQIVGCGNGMLAMDSVFLYPSLDSTVILEFIGEIYAFNKFLVRNTYKIEQIDSNNIKLINLYSEERLPKDSLNHTDSYGMKQGKWLQKLKNGFVLRENNYLDSKKHGTQLEYYGSGKLRFKENYVNGKKEGYQFSYYERSSEIYFIQYIKNGISLWAGFPLANKKFIYPLKDFHIGVDSVYVIAPYNNGNTWYEGAFLNPKQKSTTGKRVGIHKVYHTNGQLKAILDFDKKRITEFDSLGTILRDNDTFDNGTLTPTNFKK